MIVKRKTVAVVDVEEKEVLIEFPPRMMMPFSTVYESDLNNVFRYPRFGTKHSGALLTIHILHEKHNSNLFRNRNKDIQFKNLTINWDGIRKLHYNNIFVY